MIAAAVQNKLGKAVMEAQQFLDLGFTRTWREDWQKDCGSIPVIIWDNWHGYWFVQVGVLGMPMRKRKLTFDTLEQLCNALTAFSKC